MLALGVMKTDPMRTGWSSASWGPPSRPIRCGHRACDQIHRRWPALVRTGGAARQRVLGFVIETKHGATEIGGTVLRNVAHRQRELVAIATAGRKHRRGAADFGRSQSAGLHHTGRGRRQYRTGRHWRNRPSTMSEARREVDAIGARALAKSPIEAECRDEVFHPDLSFGWAF